MEKIKLNRKIIYSPASGIRYVEMSIPEGWDIRINTRKDDYGGYQYPYTFLITLKAKDGYTSLRYLSPRNYVDDHIKGDFNDGQIDEDGKLLKRFKTIDEYLEDQAAKDLKECLDLYKLEAIEDPEAQRIEKERKEKAIAENRRKGLMLPWYYDRKLVISYGYSYNGTKMARIYACVIEAENAAKYGRIPIGALHTLHPSVRKYMADLQKEDTLRQDGDISYPMIEETRWKIDKLLTMDCRIEDYEDVLNNIFLPIMEDDIVLCDDILNDYKKIQQQLDVSFSKQKEEKKTTEKNEKCSEKRAWSDIVINDEQEGS